VIENEKRILKKEAYDGERKIHTEQDACECRDNRARGSWEDDADISDNEDIVSERIGEGQEF